MELRLEQVLSVATDGIPLVRQVATFDPPEFVDCKRSRGTDPENSEEIEGASTPVPAFGPSSSQSLIENPLFSSLVTRERLPLILRCSATSRAVFPPTTSLLVARAASSAVIFPSATC